MTRRLDPHRHAGDIGRQKVGSELHTAEPPVDAAGQRLAQACLTDAGDVLDQHMPITDESENEEMDHIGLPADRLFDVVANRSESLCEAFARPMRGCTVSPSRVGVVLGCGH